MIFFSKRVLGPEGGEAASGQGIITPDRFSAIVGEQITSAKAALSGYLPRLSPQNSSLVHWTLEKANSWLIAGPAAGLLVRMFWNGVKAMSPQLAASLTSSPEAASLAKTALKAWPVTLGTILAVGAWDLGVLRSNRFIVASYVKDKARREYEADHPIRDFSTEGFY